MNTVRNKGMVSKLNFSEMWKSCWSLLFVAVCGFPVMVVVIREKEKGKEKEKKK